jgi:hypothetical protein
MEFNFSYCCVTFTYQGQGLFPVYFPKINFVILPNRVHQLHLNPFHTIIIITFNCGDYSNCKFSGVVLDRWISYQLRQTLGHPVGWQGEGQWYTKSKT